MDARSQRRKVSILMLTHNAPRFVWISIASVRRHTAGMPYELVVVDNRSNIFTRLELKLLKRFGYIDKLVMVGFNALFAKGNNIAAAAAATDSELFLLLNSDIEVRSNDWLASLVARHDRGVSALGVAEDPRRADGYCYLIDSDLYQSHRLDESHEWWWAITKQQAIILNEGHRVFAVRDHEWCLHHFGGKSGSAFMCARGMHITRDEVAKWFRGKEVDVADDLGAALEPR